jgi:hypothetical protein
MARDLRHAACCDAMLSQCGKVLEGSYLMNVSRNRFTPKRAGAGLGAADAVARSQTLRRVKHGPIQPMVKPTLLERLLGRN